MCIDHVLPYNTTNLYIYTECLLSVCSLGKLTSTTVVVTVRCHTGGLHLEPIHCMRLGLHFNYTFLFTMCTALHQHLTIVLNTGFTTQFASGRTFASDHARIRYTKSTVPSTIIGLVVLTFLNCTIHARITIRVIIPSMAYTIIYVFNRCTNTTFILPLSKDRSGKPGLHICISNY